MSDYFCIQRDKEYEEAKEMTFKYLRHRERSEKEVKDYLTKKGYSQGVIEAVLERVKELDYVNDRRFTQLWIKSRVNSRQKGSEFLKKELMQKGINADLIEDIIVAEYNPEHEYAAALEVARKKLKSYLNKPGNQKERLWRFLAQRGFDNEIIANVVHQVLEEQNQN